MRPDRSTLTWGQALAYLVYAAIGDIPGLSSTTEFSTVVSAGIFILLYLVHSYSNLGVREATKFLAVAGVVGYCFEYLFITTGWLGKYVYTADLVVFLGPVPAFIPLLWASLGYFCLLAGGNYIVSALLMMLLDVSFDPKFSTTLWRWVPPGQYYGVPIANFVGWFFTALVIFVVYRLLTKKRYAPDWKPVSFYLSVGVLIGAVPDLVPGLYGAGETALVLFAVVGLFLFAAVKGLFRERGGRAVPQIPEVGV